MPYCPECLDEFQEWVKVCPDCNVALIEELPEQSETGYTDEPLVHVATAPNEPLGMMWKEILENEGIHPLVKSGNLKAAQYMPSLLSHCKIYVLSSRADEAREILEPFLES